MGPDVIIDEVLEYNQFLHEKIEIQSSNKGRSKMNLFEVQEITNAHSDSIWVAKFSLCGTYLATGGKDACLKVWRVKEPEVQVESREEIKSAEMLQK